ncbi:hypothetical protein UT5_03070 [Ferrigenium sp. UT5]
MQYGKAEIQVGRKGVQQVQQHDRIHATAQTQQHPGLRRQQWRKARRCPLLQGFEKHRMVGHARKTAGI